ncbi:cytochrome P450 [Mycena floridula]|nr:cytochrome P450 [Mycena floridula]
MTLIAQLSNFNFLLVLGISIWLLLKVIEKVVRRSYTNQLCGPTSSPSFLYGYQLKILENQEETANLYQQWAAEYGSVFSMPWILGHRRIVLMDPTAIAHFYARGESIYTGATDNETAGLLPNSILTAEGAFHRRQRKAFHPSFSPATIRGITALFFNVGYKLKAAWDSQIDASAEDFATIEVQKWMTAVALDSIGMGGFSHDFGTVGSKEPFIATEMDSFEKRIGNRPVFTPMSILAGYLMPVLLSLPLPIGRARLFLKLKESLTVVGNDLVKSVQEELGKQSDNKSVIGTFIKSSDIDVESLSREDIQGQMNTLLLAGYVTTAISMTWSLIELARAQDKQQKLREELSSLGPNDPTYDQLSSATTLPYLDAVVHEILRLYPAVTETPRQCNENNIIPLSSPITTRDGQVVCSVAIPKGADVVVPIRAINTSETFWGPDAKEFKPERWLVSECGLAKDIQAHRHILTFVSGPRECLGKTFALTEFKSVLSVIIRNYKFELPHGPETRIGEWRGLLVRPNVEGEVEGRVPMIVRKNS